MRVANKQIMRKPRSKTSFRWCGWVVFIALLTLEGIRGASAQEANVNGAPLPPPARVKLPFNYPLRAEIAPTEERYYEIELLQGQHVLVTLACWGLPVSLSIFDPQLNQGVAGGRQTTAPARAVVALSVEHTGTYHINLGSRGKRGQTGQYELVATTIDQPSAAFYARTRAQELMGETWRFYTAGTKEANQQAIEKGLEALVLLSKLEEPYFEWEMGYLVGDTLRSLGDYPSALRSLNRALQVAKTARLYQKQAETLTTIGQVYNSLGDYQKSLLSFQQALPLWEQEEYFDPPRTLIGWTLLGLASTYDLIGEREQALEYFNRGAERYREQHQISLSQQPNGIDQEFHRGMTMVSQGLGAVYAKLGDKQKALDSFAEMYNHVKLTNWWYAEAQALNNLANVYASLGEFPIAQEKYTAALAITRKAGDQSNEADVLISLGNFYRLMSEFNRAQEHLQQGLEIYRTLGAKRGQARALTSLAKLFSLQGQPKMALVTSQEALKIWEEIGDRYGEGTALNEVGSAHVLLNELEQANVLFRRALELRRNTGDREGEAHTLYRLARLARADGNLQESQSRIEAALNLTEAVRASVLSQELRASYLSTTHDYYEFYIDLLMQLDRQHPTEGYAAAALQASEMARARLLLDMLAEARADIRQGAPPALIAQERELQQRLNAKAEHQFQLYSKPCPPEKRAVIANEVQTLTQELQALQARIRATSPRYAALTQPHPLPARVIQEQVLDGQTLLLEYALGKERSYLWAVTSTTLHAYELPPRAEIETLARRCHTLLAARNQRPPGEHPAQRRARIAQADAAWLAAAGQLSQLLLGPVFSELANKRLLIVGQGALQYVPFNALPEPKRGLGNQPSPRRAARPTQGVVSAYRPLIAEHEVIVLPSASILTLLRRDNGPLWDRSKTTIAILADPVFTADDARVRVSSVFSGAPFPEKNGRPLATAVPLLRALRDLNTATNPQPSPRRASAVNEDSFDPKIPRLYATRHEAEAISALLPAQQQLRALDFAASRATATSSKLGQYQIIHFATHALIDDLHPELSGIVLSLVDEQGQPQDGFLRAHEIYNLKLPADLVVLSACQTGLGKDVQGEGLIGLTHSFMYAGAARVIVSSWKIDDTATATLMAAFYQNLFNAQHLSLAAAFRAAQIQAWRSGRWPSPYFWAGFTFQGDWR